MERMQSELSQCHQELDEMRETIQTLNVELQQTLDEVYHELKSQIDGQLRDTSRQFDDERSHLTA